MNNKEEHNATKVLHTLSKEEKNKWKPIGYPLTLKEALNRKSKADLNIIRKQLELKGVSQLKKDELIVRLCEQYPARVGELCAQLDEERYQLLLNIANNQGLLKKPNLTAYQVKLFEKLGLFFSGRIEEEMVLVMPEEISEALLALDEAEIKNQLQRNTEYIKLAKGLLFYYGCLTFRELYEFTKPHIKDHLLLDEYSNLINDANSFYNFMEIEGGFIFHAEVQSKQSLAKVIAKRTDLNHRTFSKSELVKAASGRYVEPNRYYSELVRYFEFYYAMAKDEANDIAQEIVFLIKNGTEISKITEFLQEVVEIDSLETMNELMAIVLPLSNHTRQWVIKGYMPVELRSSEKVQPIPGQNNVISLDERRKPGRNEKCLCGSGKKFKKCCGR